MRVVALIAAYNEQRFIGGCLEHLHCHGVETYLIDNSSTDETVAIAERHLGDGLCGIEELRREGRLARLARAAEGKRPAPAGGVGAAPVQVG